jgi:hypothetical protein
MVGTAEGTGPRVGGDNPGAGEMDGPGADGNSPWASAAIGPWTLSRCVIRAGASRGKFAASTVKLRPALAVNMFVPSRSISASSPACEEEDNPRTPTQRPFTDSPP